MPHRGTTSSRGLPLRVRRHVDDRGLIVPLVLANVLILAMIAAANAHRHKNILTITIDTFSLTRS